MCVGVWSCGGRGRGGTGGELQRCVCGPYVERSSFGKAKAKEEVEEERRNRFEAWNFHRVISDLSLVFTLAEERDEETKEERKWMGAGLRGNHSSYLMKTHAQEKFSEEEDFQAHAVLYEGKREERRQPSPRGALLLHQSPHWLFTACSSRCMYTT